MARTKLWWWIAAITLYSALFLFAAKWRVECLFLFLMTGVLFGPAQSWKKRVSAGTIAFVAIYFAFFAFNAVTDGGVLSEFGIEMRNWLASISTLVLAPIVVIVRLAATLFGYAPSTWRASARPAG
jgi:hypothetical protein